MSCRIRVLTTTPLSRTSRRHNSQPRSQLWPIVWLPVVVPCQVTQARTTHRRKECRKRISSIKHARLSRQPSGSQSLLTSKRACSVTKQSSRAGMPRRCTSPRRRSRVATSVLRHATEGPVSTVTQTTRRSSSNSSPCTPRKLRSYLIRMPATPSSRSICRTVRPGCQVTYLMSKSRRSRSCHSVAMSTPTFTQASSTC